MRPTEAGARWKRRGAVDPVGARRSSPESGGDGPKLAFEVGDPVGEIPPGAGGSVEHLGHPRTLVGAATLGHQRPPEQDRHRPEHQHQLDRAQYTEAAPALAPSPPCGVRAETGTAPDRPRRRRRADRSAPPRKSRACCASSKLRGWSGPRSVTLHDGYSGRYGQGSANAIDLSAQRGVMPTRSFRSAHHVDARR